MSTEELALCEFADEAAFRSPTPTQVVSSDEYKPTPQTAQQAHVEQLIKEMADIQAQRYGMSRRKFLSTNACMATAFTAMNTVFGPLFDVGKAEVAEISVADARRKSLSNQLIFDVHTHFVRDDFKHDDLLGLAKWAADAKVNPTLNSVPMNLSRLKFENYLKEMFLDSDTKTTILTSATFGSTCVTNPRFCAAFLGQLVDLMEVDRVVWGTDSVYFGSPQ